MRRPWQVLVILVVVGLTAAGVFGLWIARELEELDSTPLIATGGREVIEVPPGTSLATLAHELGERGWINHPRILRLYGRISGKASAIKAGEYAVEPGMTAVELLDRMVAGNVIEHSLTIVEGWTFRELISVVEADPALRHILPDQGAGDVMAALGHDSESPEGRFLPETYRFPRGTTDIAFLQRAYDAMQKELQRQWERHDKGLPLKSPYQALILASIVEKETALPSERPRIAGVFIRRLERGMPLQTDPAVIYGLGVSFDGNLRLRDLHRDTPYNTYIHKGLPPTPIAMPGRASLAAVMHPADGDALYFVARGDGSHEFSSTLAKHNQAVRKYQLHEP